MVSIEEAKRLALKALTQSELSASGIGYQAFPNAKFRGPQAAALASRNLRRQLIEEGLIESRAHSQTYKLTVAGVRWIEQNATV